MFCTKCGTELKEQDNFCSICGAGTARAAAGQSAWSRPASVLSRDMSEAKIAGVCAGFARHFGLDVTVVRIIWVALTLCPVPSFGLVAYIVAWIVMPKDPMPTPARVVTS